MCHVFSCHGGSCCSCVLVFVNALVVDAVHVLECFSCHGGSRCFYFVHVMVVHAVSISSWRFMFLKHVMVVHVGMLSTAHFFM